MQLSKMPKYDAYKDSGVEWLGDIPEGWEVKKIKYLFYISRGRVISQQELDEDGSYPVYSSQTKNDGVLGYIKTYDYDCNQITWTTDGANAGTIFLRKGKYNCTNVCGTLQPKKGVQSLEFLSYSLYVSSTFYKRPDTNGAKIMNNEMAEIFVPFPPTHEQILIAKFLDQKTAQIDKAIEIKHKQIELLKEQKQIVINNAVTKGLNPNAPMKDSGIEWIGEIPKEWEVKRFKDIFSFNKGLSITKDNLNDESGVYCVNYGEIHSKYGFELDTKVHDLKYVDDGYLKSSESSLLNCGDFIFADTSEDIEGAGNFTYLMSSEKTFAGYHTIICRPRHTIYPRFFAYEIESISFRTQIRKRVKGVKVYSITQGILKDILVWIPSLLEQQLIVAYIEEKTNKIDKAIELQNNQIDKLKEYKASLINSVVTGKVQVIDEMIEGV